jgi:hypothetical protein
MSRAVSSRSADAALQDTARLFRKRAVVLEPAASRPVESCCRVAEEPLVKPWKYADRWPEQRLVIAGWSLGLVFVVATAAGIATTMH